MVANFLRAGVLVLVGAFAVLGLVTWRSDLPLKVWWATCLGLAVLVVVGHGIVVEWRHRRWNTFAVAARRAGVFETPSPPRGSLIVLGLGLGLALAGAVLLVFGLVRRFA